MFGLALILLLLGIGLSGAASYLYTRNPATRCTRADQRVGIFWLFPAPEPHEAWGYLALVGALCLFVAILILVLAEPRIPVLWR